MFERKIMEKQDFNAIFSQASKSGVTSQKTFEKASNAKKVGRKAKNESEKSSARVLLYFTPAEFGILEQIGAEKFMGISAQAVAKQVILNFIKNGSR